jgi:endonuclease/exonuclease/phosphatase (EEP) superfamily protein YafD
LARLAATFYLVALALVPLCFRFVGERQWVVAAAMYLPRIGFLFPMPFVVAACWMVGERRRALIVAFVSTGIVVFPLMGYQLFGRNGSAARSIRVMSWNTYFGRVDNAALRSTVIEDEKPDVFLGQAVAHRTKDLFRDAPGGYAIEIDDEFLLASRFPVVEKYVPPPFADDTKHKPNFVRYTLDTPFGLVDVYNVHPRSPRTGLDRLLAFLMRLRRGDVADDPSDPIDENTGLRQRQIDTLVDAMRASKHPILIGGDTNLPTLSWLFSHAFGQLRDGFSEVGQGVGYTFPAKRKWMRIDRILADASFRFLRFRVGTRIASDHLYVVADLTRDGP